MFYRWGCPMQYLLTSGRHNMTTSTPEAPVAEEKKPLVFENEMHKMQFDMLKALIEKRNSLVGKINAAQGDKESLTANIRDNSDDPEIVAAREALAQAIENLNALVSPQVDAMIADSAGSISQFEADLKECDGKIKPGVTFFKKLYENDGSFEHLPKQERLNGAVKGGSGTRRIRGFNTIVTFDGETKEFDNFTNAAKYLDVETSDLQAKFFSIAGTDVLKNVADEVEFTLTIEETDEDQNVTSKTAHVKAYRTEAAETAAAAEPTEDEPVTEPETPVEVNLEDL